MTYIFGTVKEVKSIKCALPAELYQAAHGIVATLDAEYGADRDVYNSDGGCVLILGNVQDLREAAARYPQIYKGAHELMNLVKCASGDWVNALFLTGNEFGVDVFIPKAIAPQILLDELEDCIVENEK